MARPDGSVDLGLGPSSERIYVPHMAYRDWLPIMRTGGQAWRMGRTL